MTNMERPKSQEIFRRLRERVPGGVSSPVRAFRSVDMDPLVAERGAGAYLYDADGNRYIDFVLSWGPLALGHAHPEVVRAVSEQASKGTSFGVTTCLEANLAELVTEAVPSMERLRFVNSGTEAGMSVIRLARGYTGRSKIVKFAGCYHGHADSLLVKAGSGVLTLGLPDCAGVPEGATRETLTAQFNDIESVKELFRLNKDEIACVILEPVIGNCGFIPPKEGFLKQLEQLTKENKALLIFDEVMTGFRVAPGGAQELFGITPDLTMLGKVIGGGLPVGAYGGRAEIMAYIAPEGPVYQAGTLSGNPLAMVAGIATLTEWRKPGVFEKSAKFASSLVQALQEIGKAVGFEIQARSIGTMFGFFFSSRPVWNYADANNSDRELFNRFYRAAFEHGLYFAQSPFEAGFVSSAHDQAVLDETIAALRDTFGSIA